MKKIKVFVDSLDVTSFNVYQCTVYFEGSARGYQNFLSKDTIAILEQSGVEIERIKDSEL